jgi:hypothetical protein
MNNKRKMKNKKIKIKSMLEHRKGLLPVIDIGV